MNACGSDGPPFCNISEALPYSAIVETKSDTDSAIVETKSDLEYSCLIQERKWRKLAVTMFRIDFFLRQHSPTSLSRSPKELQARQKCFDRRLAKLEHKLLKSFLILKQEINSLPKDLIKARIDKATKTSCLINTKMQELYLKNAPAGQPTTPRPYLTLA